MAKLTFIENLFSEGSRVSSMRVSVFALISCFALLLIAVAIYLIFSTFNAREIDWEGISYFIVASSAPLGAVLGTKAYQKKQENNA